MISRRHFLIRSFLLATACGMVLLLGLLAPAMSTAQQTTRLTISAGAGLRNVLLEIQQAYTQQAANVTISYNFAASGALRRQIEQGAPADVAMLASVEDMDALQSQNLLLEGTHKNVFKSEVVLIMPRDSTGVASFQDLTHQVVRRIAIGEPRGVPLGQYAEEVFNYFGIREQLQPKLVYARNALEIMSYVEAGNVDAGIVHDTNARQSDQVRLVAIAPAASHTPVIYPVAILKGSRNPETAAEFVQFLSSDQAVKIFKEYGYGIPES